VILRFLAGIGLCAWLLAASAQPTLAGEFTPAQRNEIINILREALRTDPSILTDAIEALRSSAAREKEQAQQAAIAALRAQLATDDDPVLGNPRGDVTVVLFFDIRCGYCRKLQPELDALLAKDKQVRLVMKDLPILGEPSVLGAKALLAAQAQGGYAKLYHALMDQAAPPTKDSIRADAKRLGLDADRLLREMESAAVKARIDAHLQIAQHLGIEGTPALVIGQRLIPGAVPVAELQHAVREARATH